jgi:hypothetical protein
LGLETVGALLGAGVGALTHNGYLAAAAAAIGGALAKLARKLWR